MNPAEQTVTWLIALGVLESPKKRVSDPESFLQSSLEDGVVLCRLIERLRPGSLLTVFQEPKSDGECLSNIKEFLKGCASYRVEIKLLFELVAFEADRGRQIGALWEAGNHIGLILYKPNQTAVCTL